MYIKPLAVRLATLLFAAHLAAPAAAERLEDMWQHPRDFWNQISDDACAGDQEAYDKLVRGSEVEFNPVAMTDLTWVLTNSHCAFSTSDLTMALHLTRQSADMGYPVAMSNFGEYLMEGEGIERDPTRAKVNFYAAMDAGYGNAAARLGLYYTTGEFLPVDEMMASALYVRAQNLGADAGDLEKLNAALQSLNQMQNQQSTAQAPAEQSFESEAVNGLFTNAWGIAYGEARWDFAPNGVFDSRVFVGVYEDEKQIYLGMMRDMQDPIVNIAGIFVTHSDGSTTSVDLSFCDEDTCFVEGNYNDNDEYTGGLIEVTIPKSQHARVMEALKSGRDIGFKFQTLSSRPKDVVYTNTLSLKGSRNALERLERQYGLASGVARPTPSRISESQYNAAVATLKNELNLTWAAKRSSPQAGSAIFQGTDTPCVFQTFVQHPNTGKTTREFNLGMLDANRIEWPDDLLGGKTSYLEVTTIGTRKVTKLWTDYPDGSRDYRDDSAVSLYIGTTGNFDGIKPPLATAISYCNSLAGL